MSRMFAGVDTHIAGVGVMVRNPVGVQLRKQSHAGLYIVVQCSAVQCSAELFKVEAPDGIKPPT